MILTRLLVQDAAGHVDVDGMDTSVAPADDFLDSPPDPTPRVADTRWGAVTP